MNITEAKAQRDAINIRVLQIEAEMLERKRQFFSEGIATPPAERIKLDAERAKLVLERQHLFDFIRSNKAAEQRERSNASFTALKRLLVERGMGELVVEADRIAADQSQPQQEKCE